MLHSIRAGGAEAFCSDLVVKEGNNLEVQFVSVGGHQAAVKAVLAGLLEGYHLHTRIQGKSYTLYRSEPNYHMQTSRLASGLAQGVVFPQSALFKKTEEEEKPGVFFLLSHDPKATQGIFFHQLNARVDLPLHESWAPWLWRLFQESRWLDHLTTLAGLFEGYLASLQPDLLQIEITQALQEKQPELMACFQAA